MFGKTHPLHYEDQLGCSPSQSGVWLVMMRRLALFHILCLLFLIQQCQCLIILWVSYYLPHHLLWSSVNLGVKWADCEDSLAHQGHQPTLYNLIDCPPHIYFCLTGGGSILHQARSNTLSECHCKTVVVIQLQGLGKGYIKSGLSPPP